MEIIDSDTRIELNNLIEQLTTSGKSNLDKDLMKNVKLICKKSTGYIDQAHHLILLQLKKNHSEIRLSAFQILNELFMRSHHFRETVLINFKNILQLVTTIEGEKPLPPPEDAAQKLTKIALTSILVWNETFNGVYAKLAAGVNYLRKIRQFELVEEELQHQRTREAAELDMEARSKRVRLECLLKEISDLTSDVEDCTNTISNCFNLLVPTPDLFDFYDNNHQCDSPFDELVMTSPPSTSGLGALEEKSHLVDQQRAHGMASYHGYSVELNLGDRGNVGSKSGACDVTQNDDNSDVISSLREHVRQARRRFLPRIERWIHTLAQCGGDNDKQLQVEDMKKRLLYFCNQFNKLTFIDGESGFQIFHSSASSDDSDSDEFEDVAVKEGFEAEVVMSAPSSPRALPPQFPSTSRTSKWNKAEFSNYGQKNTSGREDLCNNIKDPTTAEANFISIEMDKKSELIPSSPESDTPSYNNRITPTNARRNKHLQTAPVVPFDLDLHYWGHRPIPAMITRKDGTHGGYLKANDPDDIIVPKGTSENLLTRTIPFGGRFEPVSRECGAPLSTGDLCRRMDRYKCPFHGRIIARDDLGVPLNNEEGEAVYKQREIVQSIRTRKKKTVKRRYPGLTDLKRRTNTARRRLVKKVLSKKSLIRVSDNLDAIEERKRNEKFCHTFTHVFRQ